MNIVSKIFEEHNGSFANKLLESGFTVNQAQNFLPEAARSLSILFHKSDVTDVIISALSGDHKQLLNSLNITNLANRSGLDTEQTRSGVEILLPEISDKISQYQGGISSLVPSINQSTDSSIFSKAKSFFS